METILARASIGISELKINPTATIEKADGPVAVLNRNKPVAYLIPAAVWEAIYEYLEDMELVKIVKDREGLPTKIVDVDAL